MKKTLVFIAVMALMIATSGVANAQVGYGGSGNGGGSRSGDRNASFGGQVLGASIGPFGTVFPGQVLGASTFNFTSFMGVGSRGPEVVALQDLLRAEGFFTGASTGYFGPITMAAVQAYQRVHGISATGFVGPLTLASLNSTTVASLNTDNGQAAVLRSQLVSLINQLMAQLQAQLAAAVQAGQ